MLKPSKDAASASWLLGFCVVPMTTVDSAARRSQRYGRSMDVELRRTRFCSSLAPRGSGGKCSCFRDARPATSAADMSTPPFTSTTLRSTLSEVATMP